VGESAVCRGAVKGLISVHGSRLGFSKRIDVFRSRYEFNPFLRNWRDDRRVVPNLRRAPPTSVYVYVRDGTAPVPPGFTIAKYSSRLGMANRMIASRAQPELDSPQRTAISDRNFRSCAIAYPKNAAARLERQRALSRCAPRLTSNT